MSTMPLAPAAAYTCPGETYAISRSVHLARLGSFYERCRSCPHRQDTGLLPDSVRTAWDRVPTPVMRQFRLVGDGLRGRYLNDLTRQDAQRWASVLAAWLWNRRPLRGRAENSPPPDLTESCSKAVPRPLQSWHCGDLEDSACANIPLTSSCGPQIVVGFDERPSSPDLVVGVVRGLRQMGCRVVEIGQTLKPAWHFAAGQLAADAGVFVTGAGFDPAWTGWDILGPEQTPFEDAALWRRWLLDVSQPITRPTRSPGEVRTRSFWQAYQETLGQHFHALRPLTVICGITSPLTERLLQRLFAPLPCRLQTVMLPQPRADSAEALQAGMLRDAVCEWEADLAVGCGEDGQSLTLLNEAGTVIPATEWLPWMVRASLAASPCRRALVAHSAAAAAPRLASLATVIDDGLPALIHALRDDASLCAVDAQLRLWWGDPQPVCDGLVTLAAILRAASWSAAPLSEQIRPFAVQAVDRAR